MSIDDVRDYRNELGRSIEAMLVRISPFRADIERRLAGEQAVRDCVAEHFGPVGMIAYRSPSEDVPPLPLFAYPTAPKAETYIVISVGCTECNTTSDPSVTLTTTDYKRASNEAREIADGSGSQGDAFVVRLSDGAIVAHSGGRFGDEWIVTAEEGSDV